MADRNNKSAAAPLTKKATPKLVLRTYRPTDFDAVRQLYVSTMFALVPEGVRRKLWSAMTWLVWFLGYTLLLTGVPTYIVHPLFPSLDLDTSYWIKLLKLLLTFGWALVGFAAMFIVTDRFEMTDKVDQALENDLKDPEAVYLTYNEEQENNNHNNKKEEEEEADDQEVDKAMAGHFWVLMADDEVCGMLGLALLKEPLMDRRPSILPIWKQLVRSLTGIRFASRSPTVMIAGQPRQTATIVRWAVTNDYQQCGFSSLLMHRAMTWAKEANVTTIVAMTNEVEMAAEQILQRRHGFELVSKKRIGWFGRYGCIWARNVDDWIEKNKNHINAKFKKQE